MVHECKIVKVAASVDDAQLVHCLNVRSAGGGAGFAQLGPAASGNHEEHRYVSLSRLSSAEVRDVHKLICGGQDSKVRRKVESKNLKQGFLGHESFHGGRSPPAQHPQIH